MSVSYKVIGRHIQEARKRMKLTQREIAEKLNMSDTYYGKIERGECRTNLERLAQISVLLNVPLEDLISGCMENAVPSNADNPQKPSKPFANTKVAFDETFLFAFLQFP